MEALVASALTWLTKRAKALGQGLADKLAHSAEQKLLAWLQARLDARGDGAALEKLAAKPEASSAHSRARGALLELLEEEDRAAEELKALLEALPATVRPEIRQEMAMTGNNNVGMQIAGDGTHIGNITTGGASRGKGVDQA